MGNGLIFGRSPNLILGAFAAILGALNGLSVTHLDGTQMGLVTAAVGGVIAVVANTASIQQAAGKAAAARAAK